MPTLLHLIGEQPIPNLLVARALNAKVNLLCYSETTQKVAVNLSRMLTGAELHAIEPYDLLRALEQINALCKTDPWINLTGGTKPMALAAYEVARARRLPWLYLQSEGGKSILYHYAFGEHGLTRVDRHALHILINIDDYLSAHGLHPHAERGPANEQESGLRHWFERHVDECRSNLVFDAFEIDFLLRRGDRVAVVECKAGRKNSRFGIDQLNTIAGRTYLGTYTRKLYLVPKPLGSNLMRLAREQQVTVVALSGNTDPRTGRFIPDAQTQNALRRALDDLLGAPSFLTQG